jgi:hypothetical protein
LLDRREIGACDLHGGCMQSASAFRLLLACSAVLSARVLDAQIVSFTTPNVVNDTGAVSSLLGETRFINHGLVGIGRVSGSILDAFGDTFGSVSGMHLTNWTRTESGTYSGIFNTLPDRGYNTTTATSSTPTTPLASSSSLSPLARTTARRISAARTSRRSSQRKTRLRSPISARSGSLTATQSPVMRAASRPGWTPARAPLRRRSLARLFRG